MSNAPLTNGQKLAAILLVKRVNGRLEPIDAEAAKRLIAAALKVDAGPGWQGSDNAYPVAALQAEGCDIQKWTRANILRKNVSGVDAFVVDTEMFAETGFDPIMDMLMKLSDSEYQAAYRQSLATVQANRTR